MELHPSQNHRVPVFAPLRMEGVEQECSAGAFLVAFLVISATGPGTGDTSGAAGRYRTKRRRRGHAKICITLILDSKTQRCGAGGRAARRGMGSLSTLS